MVLSLTARKMINHTLKIGTPDGAHGEIMFVYLPIKRCPTYETKMDLILNLNKRGEIPILIVIDEGGGDETISSSDLNPPFRRSASQKYIDQLKVYSFANPSLLLFFTWQVAPTEDQIRALVGLGQLTEKEVIKKIDQESIIATLKN